MTSSPPKRHSTSTNCTAHVGHTGTADDLGRIIQCSSWLEYRKLGSLDILGKADPIDLRKGRDFLMEVGQYSCVVLHFLFRGGVGVTTAGVSLNGKLRSPQMLYSELGSWSFWRRRLVQTGALYIFAFGGRFEVGGTFLVNLDGYATHRVDDEFYVFEKLCSKAS